MKSRYSGKDFVTSVMEMITAVTSAVRMRMTSKRVSLSNCRISNCNGIYGCIRVVPPDFSFDQYERDELVLLHCVANKFEHCEDIPFVEGHKRFADDGTIIWTRPTAEEYDRFVEGATCWLQDTCVLERNTNTATSTQRPDTDPNTLYFRPWPSRRS